MKLVHYYAPLFAGSSGVTAAISMWAEHQVTAGYSVTLIGMGRPEAARQAFPATVELRTVDHVGHQRMTAVPQRLAGHIRGADLLVLHEGWTPSHYAAAAQARFAGVPYVIMPHGVHNREWRRLLRWEHVRRGPESRLVRGAQSLHLFFAAEAEESRSLHRRTPYFAVPTGMRLPDVTWSGGREELLWIGRYSVEHKGLDVLLRALATVPKGSRPRLTMRGTDFRGGKDRVVRQVHELGLADFVSVGPPVGGEEKWDLLAHCAGYVQPSRWESHSIGLLEALGADAPTLVSDRMPISPALRKSGVALVSRLTETELARALVELASGSPKQSTGGRTFVAEKFDWADVMTEFNRQITMLLAADTGLAPLEEQA